MIGGGVLDVLEAKPDMYSIASARVGIGRVGMVCEPHTEFVAITPNLQYNHIIYALLYPP